MAESSSWPSWGRVRPHGDVAVLSWRQVTASFVAVLIWHGFLPMSGAPWTSNGITERLATARGSTARVGFATKGRRRKAGGRKDVCPFWMFERIWGRG